MRLSEHIQVLSALKAELGDIDPEVAFVSGTDDCQTVHDLKGIALNGAFNIESKKIETLLELKLKTA